MQGGCSGPGAWKHKRPGAWKHGQGGHHCRRVPLALRQPVALVQVSPENCRRAHHRNAARMADATTPKWTRSDQRPPLGISRQVNSTHGRIPGDPTRQPGEGAHNHTRQPGEEGTQAGTGRYHPLPWVQASSRSRAQILTARASPLVRRADGHGNPVCCGRPGSTICFSY